MIYKQFQDLQLSALGMGCMRLPVENGDDAKPDLPRVKEMVKAAMEGGVNYYDTAWGYHGGNSERVMGAALADYPRERFYLATKFPGYALSNMDKAEEIFEAQLKKLGVDYFDFYLFHNVCEMNIDAYLDPKYGVYEYLMRQKQNGRIRHLGFSAHAELPVMERFLEAYGRDMEFCQIQLNYIDYEFQNARGKLELLEEHNIPVWVMEPVRGGMLAALAPEHEARLKALCPAASTVSWAFRFLQALPQPVVTLSGMSSMAQLKENLALYNDPQPLDEAETAALLEIAAEMMRKGTVPCTACRYCTAYCPMELDIPALLRLYNEHAFSGGGFIAPMALRAVPEEKRPTACIGCRSCEAVCPQQIKISEAMADFVSRLG